MNTLEVESIKEWRNWLEANHSRKTEIWLIFYKKDTGKSRFSYTEALEEAICFGWIDSRVKKIDEEKYAERFTPRKEGSVWSEANKEIARNMIKQGKMTEAGFEKLGNALNEKPVPEKPITMPADMKKELMNYEKAWENFSAFAPSYQKNYIRWVLDAKREETRAKRIKSVVERARENKKPGVI
ncbi:uncharacterized protein YdeI (YjbR/CyaY-like superfamily) [Methanohalophilus levihalophilus]|uniref:YdeI/OmpD-associated family protein n=1 Tax=Methanohalophilus levihalophilus TaxID=1431282 RepID=UPI001AE9C3A9|nr:YdeI/OmpD-associated family protein [Methanohalophilus levihalophilus]MBP2029501.1 uncharacterized protein YdeI (YjbR/CyaY-like superfamily) [Methanohalophilus levihalophilus]